MEEVKVVMWIDVCGCLPLTVLIICSVCRMLRREHVPVIYYTNLLIANLIQLSMQIILVAQLDYQDSIIYHIIFFFGAMASLYFKMCIALERYFLIAFPLLDCIRQTKGSVLVCVVIWVLCIVSIPLAIVLQDAVRLAIYALLPAPLFISCLAGALKALPAATSAPREEKQRIVGTLVLLLLNYFVMILPMIICNIRYCRYSYIAFILFLLSPFVDLILFFSMCKGHVDKLLARPCCCSMDNTAAV